MNPSVDINPSSRYELQLSHLKVSNLPDKQDPRLHITCYGNDPWKTSRQDGSGTDVLFPEVFTAVLVGSDVLGNQEVLVEVFRVEMGFEPIIE